MELEKLDLEKHLIKMGMPILQDIMGRDELEAISFNVKIVKECSFFMSIFSIIGIFFSVIYNFFIFLFLFFKAEITAWWPQI